MIVCAVLLGRQYVIDGHYGGGRGPEPGFDSHFALGKEFVSFDSSCILPLFLLDYPKNMLGSAPLLPALAAAWRPQVARRRGRGAGGRSRGRR